MSSFEEPSDQELWELAAGRDGSAFGLLFERHGGTVYNHCFRRTASWTEAEDLTSTVFLEAWRWRKDVQMYSDRILPWLLAGRQQRHEERRAFGKRRHQRFLTKLPPPQASSDFVDELAYRVDDERAMSEILAAVGRLRIEEQEAIALCDWAGVSYEAAAAALGVPVGTVRSRLSRAHRRLRERPGAEGVAPFSARSTLTLEER